jgi:hypothetical protein
MTTPREDLTAARIALRPNSVLAVDLIEPGSTDVLAR